MRWFKHLTLSRSDEKIASYIDECGLEGYGFYWALVETVALSMDKSLKCELTYPLTQWSHTLLLHRNKVSKYLGKLQVNGLIEVDEVGGKVRVKIPNLLKYRDEYSKKSGQTPDKVLTNSGQTPEQDRDRDRDREIDTDIKDLSKDKSMSGKPDVAPPDEKKSELKKQAIEVLNFLNEKTARHYRPVDTNLKLIIARLKSGASVQDCKCVIAKKFREWGTNEKMLEYLRPATLFNETKFEQYVGELYLEDNNHGEE